MNNSMTFLVLEYTWMFQHSTEVYKTKINESDYIYATVWSFKAGVMNLQSSKRSPVLAYLKSNIILMY